MRVSDLQELAGSLSEVADDAFQGFPLRLIGNRIQIHCTCRATGGGLILIQGLREKNNVG